MTEAPTEPIPSPHPRGANRWRSGGTKRLAIMVPVGFASGAPLLLTGGTLQAWLTDAGVDVATLGALSLVGLPYTLKFLWAPLVDQLTLPRLGRRRTWLVATQLLLALALGAMSLATPASGAGPIAALAVAVALFSATQDIAADAYRTDLLEPPERGLGATVFVTGYRLGLIWAGSLALLAADRWGWPATYQLMAAGMAACALMTLAIPEPEAPPTVRPGLREAVWVPLQALLTRRAGAAGMLLLVALYRLPDAFAGSLTMTFLLEGAGFDKTTLGLVYKWVQIGFSVGGGLLGGGVLVALGLGRSLILFAVLQGVTNLAFLVLAQAGPSVPWLIGAVGLENLAGGMATAAFVAFLMGLCDAGHSAFQYALLSALASLGRVFVGPAAGLVAAEVSWPAFFAWSVLGAVPAVWLALRLRPQLDALEADDRGDREAAPDG